MKNFIFLSSIFLLFISCDPFNLHPTKNDSFIALNFDFDENKRIVDTLSINLNWDNFNIENFSYIELSRFNFHRELDSYPSKLNVKNGWQPLMITDNSFTSRYNDIVSDDAPFKYRLRYYNTNLDFVEMIDSIYIKPTTSVHVPSEYDSVSFALQSYIIDRWDTIFICMDEFDFFANTFYATKPDTFYSIDTVFVVQEFCQ